MTFLVDTLAVKDSGSTEAFARIAKPNSLAFCCIVFAINPLSILSLTCFSASKPLSSAAVISPPSQLFSQSLLNSIPISISVLCMPCNLRALVISIPAILRTMTVAPLGEKIPKAICKTFAACVICSAPEPLTS